MKGMKGSRIKNIREKLGLTQGEFAKILGVHFTTINRWEKERFDAEEKYLRILEFLEKILKEAGKKNTKIRLEEIREMVKGIKKGNMADLFSSFLPVGISNALSVSPLISLVTGIGFLVFKNRNK